MATPPPGQPSGQGNIFVSYSRRDLEWVRQLVVDLDRANLPVWLDVHKLKPGVVWDSEIELALHGTDILLVVLSEHSAASRNVLDEINFALSKNRLVFPVLYRPCEIPYRLARLQHVDFTGTYEVALKELVERLRAARAVDAPAAPAKSEAPTFHRTVRTEVPPWLLATPPATAAPASRPVWKRPAVAAAVLAACALLFAALWMLRGRDASSGAQAGATRVSAEAEAGSAPPPAATGGVAGDDGAASVAEVAPQPSTASSEPVRTRNPPPPPAAREADTRSAAASPSAPPPRPAEPVRERAVSPAPSPPADAAPTPAPREAPPPAPEPEPAVPAAVTPSPAVREPLARAPEPSPPPVSRVPPARDEEAFVRRVIALYARAINEKSVSLLAQVRPTLSRSEAEALLKTTPENHTVAFEDVAVKIDGTSASVRLTRQDIVRESAKPLQTVLLLTLTKQGDGWVIERIQRAQ